MTTRFGVSTCKEHKVYDTDPCPLCRIAELEEQVHDLTIRGTQVVHSVDATNHQAIRDQTLDDVLVILEHHDDLALDCGCHWSLTDKVEALRGKE